MIYIENAFVELVEQPLVQEWVPSDRLRLGFLSKTIISGDFSDYMIMLVGGNKWPSLWMSLNEWVTDSLTQSLSSTTLIHSGIKQWLPLWVNSLHLSWNRIDLFKNVNWFMNKTSDCVYKWISESYPQQNQFV